MITSPSSYIIIDGSLLRMVGAPVFVIPEFHDVDEIVRAHCKFLETTDSPDANIIYNLTLEFTYGDIDAYTGSGARDIDVVYNQIEQAVVGYLENLTPGASFLII